MSFPAQELKIPVTYPLGTAPKIKVSKEGPKNSRSIEDRFKKLQHREHVLLRPDTYIGSIEPIQEELWLYNQTESRMEKSMVNYVPGLYKIFDEILVNAIDQFTRVNRQIELQDLIKAKKLPASSEVELDKAYRPVKNIRVEFDLKTNSISVENDGTGIDVVIHKEEKIYIPELIFGHLLTGENFEDQEKQTNQDKTWGGRNGYGSKLCLRKGTKLPTFEGNLVPIEDITCDDLLIGDDGLPRKVLDKTVGYGRLFEVSQKQGTPYVVNEEHILCLRMSDHKVIFWNETNLAWDMLWLNKEERKIQKKSMRAGIKPRVVCPECKTELSGNLGRHYKRNHKDLSIPKKLRNSPTINAPDTPEAKEAFLKMKEFAETIPADNTLDINVKDYLKLNSTMRLRLTGYVGKCVQWDYQAVELDPYVLGLWLGDGYRNGVYFAINAKSDPEILEYLEKWGEDNDAKFKPDKNNPVAFSISSLSRCGKAPLKKQLSKYDLINNKHIPQEYLVNSRDVRLKVLAGLIDSDGHVMRDGTRITIAQGMNHKKLADDIVFLVKSLGFMCCSHIKKTTWKYNGETKQGKAVFINISGSGVENIPTLVSRKKCSPPVKRDTTSTGNLEIKEVKAGEYVGIAVNENRRFVLEDFTVTHNCNIFSTRFEIETVDDQRNLRYHQVFTDNMKTIEKPTVERYTKVPFTKITFYPDLARFNLLDLNGMDNADVTRRLMERRVFDTAGWLGNDVNVYLNGEKLALRSFEKYMDLYLPARGDLKRVFLKYNDRWEIGACLSLDQKFEQVSFVNGIATFRGGKHVDYLVNQITRKMLAQVTSSSKNSTLKSQHIKDNLWVFVRSIIPDPTFDTQTKENMTLPIGKFGAKSKCELPEDFVAKIAKTGILERAKQLNTFKDHLELTKTDGGKSSRCNVPKLDDASNAGTYKSEQAILVITEGDSAKTFATTGIASLPENERPNWGCWPIRGKFLNVREATAKQLGSNAELLNLKKILGLQQNADYSQSKASLRYGGLMLLTDSDLDGNHIRGLIINFLHYFWPSLLRRNDFLKMMMTPIVRAWKLKKGSRKPDPETMMNFWTEPEYHEWKTVQEKLPGWKTWQIKYFKGLGTSTAPIAREIFQMMKLVEPQWPKVDWQSSLTPENHKRESEYQFQKGLKLPTPKLSIKSVGSSPEISNSIEASPSSKLPTPKVKIVAGGSKTPTPKLTPSPNQADKKAPIDPTDNAITLGFAKSRADDRKLWLNGHVADQTHEFNPKQTYREFVDNELRPFSVADCKRSIPSICDGLKPSQRKIMYTVFRFHKHEIKVAQLAGSVSHKSAYHHGEASLFDAIIKLAQNYVGSNNLNLLYPEGQFGTRLQNGKDSASPRYIYTFLSDIARILFDQRDESLFHYLDDDGFPVEPRWYLPILPSILLNGAAGIGTGYSTNIPSYNPLDLMANIRRLLENQPIEPMIPWYRGFQGTIGPHPDRPGSFISRGCWKKISADRIEITELPLNWAYDPYKEFLESLLDQKSSKSSKSDDSSKKETPGKRREKFLISTIRTIDTNNKGTTFFRPQIQFVKGGLDRLDKEIGVDSAFKLESAINTTNMHLYDAEEKIKKYSSAEEILQEFFHLRLEYYQKRKDYQMADMDYDFQKTSAKLRFVLEVIEDKLQIHKQKRQAIIDQLEAGNYPKLPLTRKKNAMPIELEAEVELEAEAETEGKAEAETEGKANIETNANYNYLLHMRIESFSQETIEKLTKEKTHLEESLNWLKAQTSNSLWKLDLDKFESAYPDFEADWLENQQEESQSALVEQAKKKAGGRKVPLPKKQIVKRV